MQIPKSVNLPQRLASQGLTVAVAPAMPVQFVVKVVEQSLEGFQRLFSCGLRQNPGSRRQRKSETFNDRAMADLLQLFGKAGHPPACE